jgi:hypothetical protein
MGHKPSNYSQSDRPESGGADHNSERENSGLLDRAKGAVARSDKAKHQASPKQPRSDANASKENDVNPATRED